MENLNYLKQNSKKLYNRLTNMNCVVIYNGQPIYEGLLKGFDINDFKNINTKKIIYEFDLNGKKILMLHEKNEELDKLYGLFENKSFGDLFNNSKLFNNALLIASNLPLYGRFDESLYDNNYIDKFNKYGKPIKKIYEYLSLL